MASTLATKFEYDGQGRLILRKLPNSFAHRYLHAGDRLVETRVGGNVHQQFVWAPAGEPGSRGAGYVDELVQVSLNQDPGDANENKCERDFYALADANYNVLGMVNAAGNLVERYSYSPYGQRTVFSHGWSAYDVNGDGVVDSLDADMVQTVINAGSPPSDSVCDVDGDGTVDSADLALVQAAAGWTSGIDRDGAVSYARLGSYRNQQVSALAMPLCPIGHQGLMHEEDLPGSGLIHNRARVLHSRQGRFVQRDPMGYVDGMSLYEYVGSNPINAFDPAGTWLIGDLGNKIRTIFVRRALRKAALNPFLFGADYIWGETYSLDDTYNEMPIGAVGYKMNEFYAHFLQHQEINGNWQTISVPLQSTKALVGQFTMPSKSKIPGWDIGWWLGGSHDVTVEGTMEVCKDSRYHIRNLHTRWIWYDRIDAKGVRQLLKDNENLTVILFEGVLWNTLIDGVADLDFDVQIRYVDPIENMVFPYGPMR